MSERETTVDGTAATIPLALLEGYKVRWNRETVARDVVQNFFDAAADFDEVSIDVDDERGAVRVAGRATFELDYLRYVGATSKQGQRAAGGFGEGFKICALVLVRDYRAEVRAGSGPWEIRPVMRPMKLGRELCYEVTRREGAKAESWVSIAGADAALCKAFRGARDFFRHPKNPRLAAPLHVDEAAGVGVYFATGAKRGDVFYRRQHRGTIPFPKGAALTFACDDHVEGVEADRDRRGLRAPGRVAAAVLAKVADDVLERVVRHLRGYWSSGNSALGAALREAARRGARYSFSSRWVAGKSDDYRLEEHAKRRGCFVAVSSFAAVGMPTAADRFGAVELPRPPRPSEAARIAVARDLYEALLGEPAPARRARILEVTERLHGVARATLDLPASVVAGSFDGCAGAVLSALARQTGAGACFNGERLTRLLEGVLHDPARLDPFRARWEDAAHIADDGGGTIAPEDDDAPDLEHRSGATTIQIAILAPPGFPPTDDIARRVRALTRSIRVNLWFMRPDVDGPERAAEEYARGLPSVWIGDVEIEPARGRPRYAVRTFTSPAGPRLTPSDEALEGALRAALERTRSRFHIAQKRERRGRDAHMRWLAENDPDEHRAKRIDEEVRRLCDRANGEALSVGGYKGYGLARQAVRRAVAARIGALPDWEAHLDEAALAESRAAFQAIRALHERVAPHLAPLSPEEQEKLYTHLLSAATEVADAVALDEISARIAPAVAPAVKLFAAAHDLPVDEVCKATCRASAVDLLFARAARGAALEIATAAATERLDAAVAVAVERHPDGPIDEAVCKGLDGELDRRFGHEGEAKPSREARSALVRAAWDEAIAAGMDELAAAQRCLEVAEAAARRN